MSSGSILIKAFSSGSLESLAEAMQRSCNSENIEVISVSHSVSKTPFGNNFNGLVVYKKL